MRYVTIAAVMFATASVPAWAQTDQVGQAHQMAANQLGMLEYCKAQGFVGDDAVSAERSSMGQLPPSSVSTETAEAAGKDGAMLAPNGTKTTIASMASAQGTTVADICKRMGSAVVQSAAMMRSMPTMPQMPAGMPTMPQMPAGMPALPTMPGMPGATPSK